MPIKNIDKKNTKKSKNEMYMRMIATTFKDTFKAISKIHKKLGNYTYSIIQSIHSTYYFLYLSY